MRWPERVHQVVELERDAAWHAGYDAGVRDASAAMQRAMVEALDPGPYATHVAPLNRTAKQAVEALVNRMLAETRRSLEPERTEHRGGPVPVWGDDRPGRRHLRAVGGEAA